MTRIAGAIGGLAAVFVAATGAPAKAEVLDAVYRGTMVCDRMPIIKTNRREALEVTIDGGKVRYTHVVRLRDTPELKPGRALSKGKTSLWRAAGTAERRATRRNTAAPSCGAASTSLAPRPGPLTARP